MDIRGTEGQELLDYHPCAVAAGAGGIFGRMAGQSGQMAPENMLYSDWNDCMQGDINRDLLQAKARRSRMMLVFILDFHAFLSWCL